MKIAQGLWECEYKDFQIMAASPEGPEETRQKIALSSFDRYSSRHRQSQVPLHERIKDQYARWQTSVSKLDRNVVDSVEYWHQKRFEHPRLSRMAVDVMTVPAMIAECERLFSATGLMVTPLRNRM